MKRFFLLAGLCVAASFTASAQFGALKDKVIQKTKQLGKDKGTEAVDRERDRLDSVDFNMLFQ